MRSQFQALRFSAIARFPWPHAGGLVGVLHCGRVVHVERRRVRTQRLWFRAVVLPVQERLVEGVRLRRGRLLPLELE